MATLKFDFCSVMHAKMIPGKGSGVNHSASLILSNVSFGKTAPTSQPCLSLRNDHKHHSNYNHNVLRMSARRPTKLNAAVVDVPLDEARENGVLPSKAIPLEAGEFRVLPSKVEKIYETKVVSIETLVGPKGGVGEICNIVLDHGGKFSFKEGQYLAVQFQGSTSAFSISSCSSGDSFNGQTLTLCVRRAGLLSTSVSNYLCSLQSGDVVQISGPYGEAMVFPELDANHIMVATSTGISPFRSNIQRLFVDPTAGVTFNKMAWLIAGADNYNSLLYDNEFTQIQNDNIDHFRYQRALDNSVDKIIYESGNQIFTLLDNGAYIYIAGLKTMKPGILEAFSQIAVERGVIWEDMKKKLIANGQWRVEIY